MIPAQIQAETQKTLFIGRQPIFDRKQAVYGYELLFRSGDTNAASIPDDNSATAQVIYNSLIEIGLEDIVAEKPAFINFPYELLVNGIADLLPPDKVVIEILENVEIDDTLVKGVRKLNGQGYRIALDDFVIKPEWEALIPYTNIIKIDVLNQSEEDVARHFEILKKYNIQLLAEKVETQEEFFSFNDMGFDFFQGYFFSRPRVIKKKKLPDNHIALLQLLACLQDEHVAIHDIENLVSQTVSLNYKLFRYINSAYLGLTRKFESIRQAVVYFGLQRLKNLASLIAMTGIEGKSSELIIIGLTRAKMCELLAQKSKLPEQEGYFVTGLFSILDALLDHPLQEIMKQLPLSEEIVAAIINFDGQLGAALKCSIACERCQWQEINFTGLETYEIYESYLKSITWARQSLAEI